MNKNNDLIDSEKDLDIELSIIIKALNEEHKIAGAIESSLLAIKPFKGEVILADSYSTDNTVEIAKKYPVKIVQLKNPGERCCGIGPQLGYQYAKGEFIYILDGDMQFVEGFIPAAIEVMRSQPEIAGVAGIIKELGGGSYEFEARKTKKNPWQIAGVYPWLEMGGLYRKTALESVGYFSNRNLHAFEEQELGMRLSHSGWKLVRLPQLSVLHHGHNEDTFKLLSRRWKSRYVNGSGELIRASFGKSYFFDTVKSQFNLIAMLGLWIGLVSGLILIPWTAMPLVFFLLLLVLILILMWIKKKSIKNAFAGMLNWQVRTAGLLRGLFNSQTSPSGNINSNVLQD